jgi:hypothetical protein
MCHGRWVTGKRLNTSQTSCEFEELETTYNLIDIGIGSFELERDHTTKSTHLALGKLMIWVRRQSRKIDFLHTWLLYQEAGYRSCILFVLTHAQG